MSWSNVYTPFAISFMIVRRLEYGATGRAVHNGHSLSFVIAFTGSEGDNNAADAAAIDEATTDLRSIPPLVECSSSFADEARRW